ncbi:nicotinate-nucleotide adenylyltransferase [Polymorphobacter fuscus]|uniref:Probable nicotinate-nucleotide adenylyltransferase n=1 Tax=Sandarakinorhabdus fusca TaxID=1439888 RepID=A0A7C9KZD7_9SPHN|nr:nicotinate-nucleotide adenylyltransferase [Polymorphobacter fuscus]KAB7645461.1 nicotinate-nucleotide adenylyltransferase [Polymorphobacter fuscus]MQT17888.1 nicotinate-nucleotide adenylyltransferase [Polymorphobacter fuscus]NJC08517.1 nicotinate-nucleotide adenylyltransferase [Polymorphobacter fuscus]
MKRIGLLGGSFNPAHAGHRHISIEAMRRLRLDEVWWLVSPQNPLKSSSDMAPLPARLASARRTARHPRIRASAIEARLGTRFAIDTVAALQHRHPDCRFIWLAGADILPELHRWHRWRDLLRRLPIAVLARPRYMGDALRSPAMAWARRWRRRQGTAADWPGWTLPAIVVLDIRATPVSATAIRARDPDWPRRMDHRH